MKLKKNQWLKKKELEKIQLKKLKKIIRHAYSNVKFYHDLYRENNVSPHTLNKLGDLQKFPIINKEDIRRNFPHNIVARNVRIDKCKVLHTSGSTGNPLTLIVNNKERTYSMAGHYLSMSENGFKFRDNLLQVFAYPPYDEYLLLKLGIVRRDNLSYYYNPIKYKNRLNSANYDAIFGVTSYIKLLAKVKRDEGLNNFNPRLIFTTSDLLDDSTRKLISEVFNTEPIDLYGGIEANRVAWECSKHSGYHIDIDSVICEFIKDNEHVSYGERGEIILTCLWNYSMPFIRYHVGDIAIPKEELCPCGRGLPLIKSIEGRNCDFIVLSDSRIYSPMIFNIVFKPLEEIDEFRVVQENLNELKIYFVRKKRDNANLEKEIIVIVRKLLGPQIEIEPIEIAEIPKDKSGKLRCVISNVKFDWINNSILSH